MLFAAFADTITVPYSRKESRLDRFLSILPIISFLKQGNREAPRENS
jgi:hypothetical protein